MNEQKTGKPKRAGKRKARTAVRLCVVAAAVAGFGVGGGWGVPCGFGAGVFTAACPLGALEALFAARTVTPRGLLCAALALAAAALLGRSFCAWACPVPPISRFFRPKKAKTGAKKQGGWPGPNAAITQPESKGAVPPLSDRERALLEGSCHGSRARGGFDSRHAVLLGALASSAVFGFPVFCLVCPVGLAFGTLFAVWAALVEHDPSWALVVLPVILAVELVAFRKWCHALCPLGALMSLVGRKAPIGLPRVDAGRCLRCAGGSCRTCAEKCPEGIDPHSKSLAECTRCGVCENLCPADAITLGRTRKNRLEEPCKKER